MPALRIKVLYLITELNVGGSEKVLARLLAHLDLDRFDPTVVCLFGGDGPVAGEIRALAIPVIDLKMTKWRWAACWNLYQVLRRNRPVILHTWLFHANLLGRILGRLSGVPIVICAERSMAIEREWRYYLNRWTIGLVDRVIAVSANVRDFCVSHIRLPADKLVVIYNGVEVTEPPISRQEARRKLNLPLDDFIVGVVSRLERVKGIKFLLQAFLQVDKAHLVVIGDGPERSALETQAAEIGLDHRIHWVGYRANISDLLPAFDLFAQPSLHEGLPNTILEAMVVKLPVVATAVGGIPELVIDGETGLLVPSRDSTSLAKAILHLRNDPKLRHNMGRAGFERVQQHFSLEQMVQQTQTLYEQLLSDKDC